MIRATPNDELVETLLSLVGAPENVVELTLHVKVDSPVMVVMKCFVEKVPPGSTYEETRDGLYKLKTYQLVPLDDCKEGKDDPIDWTGFVTLPGD